MGTKYYNYELCKACGGQCCTRCAGSYIPSDFKEPITPEFIVGLLKSGKFAIDWWDGDAMGKGGSSTHYIRPRHVNEGAIRGSWGGVCVNWHKTNGCSLTEQDRPFQCRKLVPTLVGKDDYKCKTKKEDKASKQDCAIAWYNHQEVIQKAKHLYYKLELEETR